MRIVVTGSQGFIARNLRVRLHEAGHADVAAIGRDATADEVNRALSAADFVFHLAGVNRPQDPAEFGVGNVDLTRHVCDVLANAARRVPVVFASSTQAALDNPYGQSKKEAENLLLRHAREIGAPVYLFRLTNVFGKWCRPNYNSAVATFCHNVARGLPIVVNDASVPLQLIHVDDVAEAFMRLLQPPRPESGFLDAGPVHATTVGDLAATIRGFAASRNSLLAPRAGSGFERALYSTYVSYLPPTSFDYTVPLHADPRGEFVEMLKTSDSGQFSYFTAHPGITRGEHYHHTKTEKFLVIRGTAHFGFRHIDTQERHGIVVRAGEARIVETVPGWTHNITNIGSDELIVMLWANEIFDREHPDTVALKVNP